LASIRKQFSRCATSTRASKTTEPHGLVDVAQELQELGGTVTRHAVADDVTQKVWSFMQDSQNELPDPEIPDKKTDLFSRLFGA
jgi:hypothetical protein